MGRTETKSALWLLTVGILFIVIFSSCVQPEQAENKGIPITEVRNTADIKDIQLIDALKSFIPHIMKNKGTPGLNIALALRGEIIWEAGFGYANLEQKVPMSPQTVTHSGSMGKTYTATAIMQLVERGIIGLDDPVNQVCSPSQMIPGI